MRANCRILTAGLMSVSLFTFASADDQPADANANKAQPKQRLFKISEKTTYLDEPLTNDGFVNYVKAIEDEYGKGVTPKNNFAVVYWQTVGPAEIEGRQQKQFFAKLGVEPLPEKGGYYVTLDEMRKRQLARNSNSGRDIVEQQGRVAEGPWSPQKLPELAEWLRLNRQHLDRLVEATKRKRFFSPMPMVDEENPPPLVAIPLPARYGFRDVARSLQARAMLRLNSSDVEGAWSDLLACHRLARLAAQDPTLIGQLVGIAIDSIAFQSDIHLSQHRALTTHQVHRIRQEFRKLSEMPPMVEKIDRAERFVFLDSVAFIARGNLAALDLVDDSPGGKAMAKLVTSTLIDWDTVLEMGNVWYNRLVDSAKQPTFARRKIAFAELGQEMKKMQADFRSPRQTMGRKAGSVILALLTPAMEEAKEVENRWTMRMHLFDVAFALAAHRAKNGVYPERLEVLVPKFLAEIPQDLYSDAKLQYRATGEDYLLYSVGRNVQDDEGQTFDSHPPGDDIVIT